ncbi:TetR/AcrR family transcriptional regulator [Alkalicoccus daliensis]|uniref:Transcriptional regulator, TetR family n=1 Tax=Alkalicoccus daliensis TaxID=745820 RepID=A0A1H0IT68_9BACI|nr:TetR/AcrR family transcriptional regulator [Alkalicoccus daliensis]SDO34637.1 transcriptional regulator, TetR family [Alkalicoccus daliensis]
MGRMKAIDEVELFQETEKLILEAGYAGFHFKALSQRLGVARSTIYNYYSKKEELITAFMVHLLRQVVERMDTAAESEEPLRSLITLWGKYANIHQMMQVMPYIDKEATEKVEKSVKEMFALLQQMRGKIKTILVQEQKKGKVRTDIQIDTLVGMVMATVQIPYRHSSEEHWAEEVYQLIRDALKS